MKKIRKKLIFFLFFIFLISGCENADNTDTPPDIKSNFYIISKKYDSNNMPEMYILKTKTKNILVNCGKKEEIKETVDFLKNNNIKEIDYLILSDFSEDNICSANVILRKLSVKNIIEPSYIPKNSESYKKYNTALKFKELSPQIITKDKDLYIDDINIHFYQCNDTYFNNDSENCSLVFTITHKNNRFLFAGNIKEERMNGFFGKNDKFDFIKISGKTKLTKNIKKFLTYTKPDFCVINCSENMPLNIQLKKYLTEKNIKYFRNYEYNYLFISDGNTIKHERN